MNFGAIIAIALCIFVVYEAYTLVKAIIQKKRAKQKEDTEQE